MNKVWGSGYVLLSMVLVLAAISTPALRNVITGPDLGLSWQLDCDRVLIHEGLLEAPNLRDTGRWWSGVWVGKVPFWRPLTSMAFWLEWKAFGWESQRNWQIVHGIGHLLAVALLFLFVQTITGSVWVATGTAVMFATASPSLLVRGFRLWTTNGLDAAVQWKDSPDLWMTACLLGAGTFAWRRRVWPALLLALVAAGFKETGFVGAALVGALLVYRCRADRRALRTPLMVFAGILALMAVVKWQATGAGYIFGSNLRTGLRMFVLLAPEPLRLLATPFAASVWTGLAVATVLLWRRRWTLAAATGAVGIGVIWQWAAMPPDPEVGRNFAMAGAAMLDVWPLLITAQIAIWFFVAVRGWSWMVGGLALVSGLLLFPCSLAPQVMPHAHYAGHAFGAATAAVAWANVWGRANITARLGGIARRNAA